MKKVWGVSGANEGCEPSLQYLDVRIIRCKKSLCRMEIKGSYKQVSCHKFNSSKRIFEISSILPVNDC